MTKKQLLDARAAKRAEVVKIADLAKKETRDLTAEEKAQTDALVEQIEGLNRQLDELEADQVRSERVLRALGASGTPSQGGGTTLPRGPEPEERVDEVNSPDPRKYSLMRAISQLASKKPVEGYERDISNEIANRTGRDPQGFFLPMGLAMRANAPTRGERRDAFGVDAGSGFIPTLLDTARFIDTLRATPIITQMGAQILSDLVGQLDLPKLTSNTQSSWNGESAVGSESTPSTDVVSFRAKTINCWYRITRRMLHQTSLDIENLFRMNAMRTLALGLDSAAIFGTGSDNQPTGLLNNTDVATIALGSTGGAPTWDAVVGMETAINDANAMAENMAYLTSQVGRGKLKRTPKIGSTFPEYLWDKDNTINGYRAMSSTLVPKTLAKSSSGSVLTAMIFGNWAALKIGLWGAVDVIVDPYTQSAGDVKVTLLQDADINVDHAESFSKIVDMVRT